uniref:Suppressor of white apricot N-terminal domain-containing protein n=1 Tax=Panagrolaimus superbus TaxID=310955 RepID=A0A914Z025_9BILA
MWHEARKAEKALYHQINTTAKRKEQTRRYHELNARDPAELLVIYGTKKKIHDDHVVAEGASEANTMTKWQGDDSVMIDRFDARNLLEIIPKRSTATTVKPETLEQFIEDMQVDYERYKELVAVEFTGDSEERVLKNIAEKEHKTNVAKLQKLQNRKTNQKVTNKKATIGFLYDDNNEDEEGETSSKKEKTFQKPESEDESSGEDDDELFSAKLNSLVFSSNDWERLNKLAEKFLIPRDAFLKLYEVDRGFELDNAKINEIERERLSLSGKSSKRDRARLRQTKAVILKDPLNEDAVASLKRFAERRMDAAEAISDDSMSDVGEDVEEKTIIISSYGDEDESTSRKKSKAEISLNTIKHEKDEDYKKLAMLKTRRSMSPFGDEFSTSKASPIRIKKFEASPSPDFSSNPIKKRSPSPKIFPKQSPVKQVKRRSLSRSASPKQKSSGSGWLRSRLQNLKKPEADYKIKKESTRQRSPSSDSTISQGEDNIPLEIRSSMSDSEKEKIEIENRKRRIRRTKKEVKQRKFDHKSESEDSDAEMKAEAARKLRAQLQKTLNKTTQELKAEQMEKKLQQEEDKEKRYDEEYFKNRYVARHSPHRSRSPSPGRHAERKRRDSYDRRDREKSSKRSRRSRSHSRSRSPRRSRESRHHRQSSPPRRRRSSRSRSRSRGHH